MFSGARLVETKPEQTSSTPASVLLYLNPLLKSNVATADHTSLFYTRTGKRDGLFELACYEN